MRDFSTGLPKLDKYLGGIQPKDTLLAFYSSKEHWRTFLQTLIAYAFEHKFPVCYLSFNDEFRSSLLLSKRVKYYKVVPARRPFPTTLNAIKRFLSVSPHRSYLIIDDLSVCKEVIGSERYILELYSLISNIVSKRNSVLVSSVDKSKFSLQALAGFKDVSSLCIELLEYQNHIYVVPLSLKNRYSPLHSTPLRLSLKEFSGRTVKEEEQKESLSPLEFNEEHYLKFFHESAVPLVLFNRSGGIREVNKQAVDLLGYSVEELKICSPLSLVVPQDRFRALRFLAEFSKRKRSSLTFNLLRKNRKSIPAEFLVTSLGGDLYAGVLREISVQTRLEKIISQVENNYRSLLVNSSFPLIIIQSNKPVYANAAFLNLFGYSSLNDVLSKRIKNFFVGGSVKQINSMLRNPSTVPSCIEVQALRRDGTAFECQVSFSQVQYDSKPSFLLSCFDVTNKNETIRRLTMSERKYIELISQASTPIVLLSAGKIVFVNRALAELFGYKSGEKLLHTDFVALIAEKDTQSVSEYLKKIETGKTVPQAIEFTALSAEGELMDIQMNLSVIRTPNGSEVLGFCRDITEQRRLMAELKIQAEEVKQVDMIAVKLSTGDLKKTLHQALNELMHLHGCEYGGVYLLSRKTKELVLQQIRRASAVISEKLSTLSLEQGIGGLLSKTHESYLFSLKKYPSYLPHRSVFQEAGFVSISFIPFISGGECVGMILLGTKKEMKSLPFSKLFYSHLSARIGDIIGSQWKLQEIKETAEQFQALTETNSAVSYHLSSSGAFLYISNAVEQLLGYKPKEFYRNPSLWLSLVHPDDKKFLLGRIANLKSSANNWTIEYRIRPKGKARYCWVRDVMKIVSDTEDNIAHIYGFVNDITDYKTVVDELSTSDTFKTEVLLSIQEGIFVFDTHLKCTYWNDSIAHLTGINASDAIGKHATELFPSEEGGQRYSLIRRSLGGEVTVVNELVLRTCNNEELMVWEQYAPLRDAQGNIKGVVGVMRDITKEKILEQKLRDSERLLSNLIDTMDDILILCDLKGTILQVNKAFLNVFGYKRKEVVGVEFPYPWLLEEEMGRYVLWISNLRQKSSLHDFDMTWRGKDGRLFSMSISTTLLRNSVGEPVALLNLARDITERKRLALQLEERNKQVELINHINTVANQTVDFEKIFNHIAKEINTILEYDDLNISMLSEDKQSLTIYAAQGISAGYKGMVIPLKQTVSQFAISTHKPVIIEDMSEEAQYKSLLSYQRGLRSEICFPIVVKEQTLGTFCIGKKTPCAYSKDTILFLQSVAQQVGMIIDRIQLFTQVTADVSFIRNLLDSIDSIVYTVDTQCRIVEVNKAWYKFLQLYGVRGTKNYRSMNLFDVLPDETLKGILQNAIGDILKGFARIYSGEYIFAVGSQQRAYQITISPVLFKQSVTGLVITHTDITALKKTELELKENNEQLILLHEISMLMRSKLNFQEVLDIAIPFLRKTIDAQAILVYILDEQQGLLKLVKQVGFEHVSSVMIDTLSPVGTATGMVVKSQEAIFISEAPYRDRRISFEQRNLLKDEKIEAAAIIPLLAREKVFGAINVFYSKRKDFSVLSRNILSLVGNQLGTAYESAQLYGELQSQLSHLTVLYELSQQLTSTLEVEAICQLVLEHTRRVVPYRKCVLSLYDEEHHHLHLSFQVETGKNRKSHILKFTQPKEIFPGSSEELVIRTRDSFMDADHAILYVPMLTKTSIIGMIVVESMNDCRYVETHLRLLESIGNLTAIALEKGKLYEEIMQKSMEIEQRNKELADFTYVVSHDLKEPLITVEGFSKILLSDYRDVIQAEGREFLNAMVGATARMKKQIDDLLMLSRVSRPTESFKLVSMSQIVEEVKKDLEFTFMQKNAKFEVQADMPTVFGNETQLKIVFSNLISNALKFNDSPVPVIEIGFQKVENNAYLFYVKDNGIGIDKEFHEKVFMIFHQLHRRGEYEGTGAGLAIVKKIIELHRGKIWVESEPNKGSTFYFTIPLTMGS